MSVSRILYYYLITPTNASWIISYKKHIGSSEICMWKIWLFLIYISYNNFPFVCLLSPDKLAKHTKITLQTFLNIENIIITPRKLQNFLARFQQTFLQLMFLLLLTLLLCVMDCHHQIFKIRIAFLIIDLLLSFYKPWINFTIYPLLYMYFKHRQYFIISSHIFNIRKFSQES